jgi:cold shock CspA family protein
MRGVFLGTVVAYDPARGLGSLQAESGEEYLFHCTAIADQSRSVEPGAAVAFSLRAAQGGSIEAVSLAKLGGPKGSG